MNDFFTPEDAPEALSAKDEKELRAKIQADVFDDVPAEFDDPDVALDPDAVSDEDVLTSDAALAAEPAVDSASVLSPEMQVIVDSVNKLTSSLTGMEDRIKQTERRVGGITNEFHAAKTASEEAAATQAKAPTPEEMADAAKNESAWEDLKKDFPSWADAISSKLKTQTSNFVSVDAFEELRQSVSQLPVANPIELETRLVGLIHPDWKQITQDPKYASWLNIQSDDVKFKAYKGTTAEEAIDVFSQFKAHNVAEATASTDANPLSEVQKIKAQRKKQLQSSTLTNTNHKTIKQKSEDEMTEAELRAHIASKVFAK